MLFSTHQIHVIHNYFCTSSSCYKIVKIIIEKKIPKTMIIKQTTAYLHGDLILETAQVNDLHR